MAQIEILGVNHTSIASWWAAEVNSDYGAGNPITLLFQTTVNESVALTGSCVRGFKMKADDGFELDKSNLVGVGNIGDTRPNISTSGAIAEFESLIISTSAHGSTTDLKYTDCLIDENFHAFGKKVLMTGCISKGAGITRALDATGGNADAIAINHTAIDINGAFAYVRFLAINCFKFGGTSAGYVQMTAGSDYNASDDATAAGPNSLQNRTASDMVDYLGGNYLADPSSDLSNSGDPNINIYIGFGVSSSGSVSLIINPISLIQSIDDVSLVSVANISIESLKEEQSIESIALTQKSLLAMNGFNNYQSISDLALIQSNNINVEPLSHSQAIEQPILAQSHILIINGVDSVQAVEQTVLAPFDNLFINGITQQQAIEQITLGVNNLLSIDSFLQAQSLDIVTLTEIGGVLLNIVNLKQNQELIGVAINAA